MTVTSGCRDEKSSSDPTQGATVGSSAKSFRCKLRKSCRLGAFEVAILLEPRGRRRPRSSAISACNTLNIIRALGAVHPRSIRERTKRGRGGAPGPDLGRPSAVFPRFSAEAESGSGRPPCRSSCSDLGKYLRSRVRSYTGAACGFTRSTAALSARTVAVSVASRAPWPCRARRSEGASHTGTDAFDVLKMKVFGKHELFALPGHGALEPRCLADRSKGRLVLAPLAAPRPRRFSAAAHEARQAPLSWVRYSPQAACLRHGPESAASNLPPPLPRRMALARCRSDGLRQAGSRRAASRQSPLPPAVARSRRSLLPLIECTLQLARAIARQ